MNRLGRKNECLKGYLSFCRHYLSSVLFVDLLGSANCEIKKSICGDSISTKFNDHRSYSVQLDFNKKNALEVQKLTQFIRHTDVIVVPFVDQKIHYVGALCIEVYLYLIYSKASISRTALSQKSSAIF